MSVRIYVIHDQLRKYPQLIERSKEIKIYHYTVEFLKGFKLIRYFSLVTVI
jgi:hypothetical protein